VHNSHTVTECLISQVIDKNDKNLNYFSSVMSFPGP